MTDEMKLLPCPFCGGESHIGTVRYNSAAVRNLELEQDTFFKVNCVKCGANNLGVGGYATEADAAEAWNARATPSSLGDGWETGWLIENYGSKHNIYRAEWLTAGIYTHADDRDHWTKDASKALRFSRKADADAVIAALGWTEARATEHLWSAAPSPGGDHG